MTAWTRLSVPAGPEGRNRLCWTRIFLAQPGRRRAGLAGVLAIRGQRRIPSPP